MRAMLVGGERARRGPNLLEIAENRGIFRGKHAIFTKNTLVYLTLENGG